MPDVPAFPPFPPLPRLQRMQVFGGMYFHGPTFEVCMFPFLLFSQVVLGLLCLFKQFVLRRPFSTLAWTQPSLLDLSCCWYSQHLPEKQNG